MSDFLANLVQRHTQASTAPGSVRPRPLARFEPDSAAAATTMPAEELTSEAGAQPGQIARLKPERVNMALSDPDEEMLASPTETPMLAAPPTGDSERIQAIVSRSPALAPAERPARHQPLPVTSTRPTMAPGGDAPEATISPAPAPPSESDERKPASPETRPAVESLEAAPASSPAPRPMPAHDPGKPVQPIAAEDVHPAPVVPAPTGHDRYGFRRQTMTTSPETIHITIGRIEVKAQREAPSAPRRRETRPAPPIMSLDDYLRRRGQEERR